MKNLIFFQKKCIFFPKNLKFFPKLSNSCMFGKKKPLQSGELERKNNIKIMKKYVSLFDGHPSIERGKFVKLLFGILFGAALEPESLWQFDM